MIERPTEDAGHETAEPRHAAASAPRPASHSVAATDDDERALMRRLAAGDDTAFDTIFRDRYRLLVHVASRYVSGRDEAEELAQDTMVALWRARTLIAPDSLPRAWLLHALRNRALNRLRHEDVRARAANRLGEDDVAGRIMGARGDAAPDAALRTHALQVAIDDAVAALTPRCREVFLASRLDGLTYAEIAARCGITVKAVEATMGRALRDLRRRLAPWLDDDG